MPMPKTFSPAKSDSPFASFKGEHVGIRVPDYDAAVVWFVEKLDFRIVHEWPHGDLRLAYVAPPIDTNFMIEILAGPGIATSTQCADLGASLNQAGWHHPCLRVDDVDTAVAELRRRGVTIVNEPFELEAISRKLAFFSDPWGNLYELAQVLA